MNKILNTSRWVDTFRLGGEGGSERGISVEQRIYRLLSFPRPPTSAITIVISSLNMLTNHNCQVIDAKTKYNVFIL